MITTRPLNLSDLSSCALDFSTGLRAHDVVHFIGPVGVGKTTFIQALAQSFNIQERVLSPTFVLLRSYRVTGHPAISMMHHIDAYRLGEGALLGDGGNFQDLAQEKGALVCVEWPYESPEVPVATVSIHFKILNGSERQLSVSCSDDSERRISKALNQWRE